MPRRLLCEGSGQLKRPRREIATLEQVATPTISTRQRRFLLKRYKAPSSDSRGACLFARADLPNEAPPAAHYMVRAAISCIPATLFLETNLTKLTILSLGSKVQNFCHNFNSQPNFVASSKHLCRLG
jgi:hypothetical protein